MPWLDPFGSLRSLILPEGGIMGAKAVRALPVFPAAVHGTEISKKRDRDLQRAPLNIAAGRFRPGKPRRPGGPLLSQRKSDGKPHCVSGRAARKKAAGCRRLLYVRAEEREEAIREKRGR